MLKMAEKTGKIGTTSPRQNSPSVNDINEAKKKKALLAKMQKKLSKQNLAEISETTSHLNEMDESQIKTPMSQIDEIQERFDEGSVSDTGRNESKTENYKNEAYYSLPENVRKAIDFAKQKQ